MLKFVGDINFTDGFFDTGFGIGSNIHKGDNPFKYLNRDNKDVWFGNLECVVSTKTNKTGIYKKQFIISPERLIHIQHLNIYSVANNHVMQHGKDSYNDMLQNIKSFGSSHVGSATRRNIQFVHQGKHVGIVSFSQRKEKYSKHPLYWYNPEYLEIESEFKKIKHLDFKIVYIHWGNEFVNRPYSDQKKFAHWLVDIGFDLVIGVHPHVLQGYEFYNGKYIFYSLGNFVFNMPTESTRYSIILNIDLSTETLRPRYDYVYIGKDHFPIIIDSKNVPTFYKFEYLNKLLINDDENELYYSTALSFYKKYRFKNYKEIFLSFYKYNLLDLIAIFIDYIKRRIIRTKNVS